MRLFLVLFLLTSLVVSKSQASVSESDFSNLISLFQQSYPDIDVQGSWESETVNAQAMRFDDSKLVVITGALAREATATVDSLAVVICHEVGHHLGDGPYFHSMLGDAWAAGEGAADYYSIQSCFNKLAPSIPEQKLSLPAKYEADLQKICAKVSDSSVCRRALVAGLIIAKLQWQILPNKTAEPRFSSKDLTTVDAVELEYGSPQCRLDTFIASALGAARPRCWFAN